MIHRYFSLFTFLLISSIDSFANMQQRIIEAEKDYIKDRFLNAVFMFSASDKTLLRGARGIFDLRGEQLRANEVIPIGGGTKAITAAAILRLQDRKLLNVNDKIDKYIDSSIWQGKKPDWVHKISIHNLLTNTSGLAEYFSYVKLDLNMSQQDINKKILLYAASKP